MKSAYRRLGDYIKEVNTRNSDLITTNLLGVNIDKFFMPSVANVVGTDMSVYKIVSKGQFVCNRMHVGRDYRLPIALSKNEETFLVSPAYDVFEVLETEVLLPEYLMMWFSRAEFDRNAWFYTDADVRGGLHWKAFCDMELPIPDVEIQREIVKEYQTIINRIELSENINRKLEDTAQALYKQWFIDFEFPDEDGKPYKSSGGDMVWCQKLGKDIPAQWEIKSIGDVVKCNPSTLSNKDNFETIQYLDTSNITDNGIEEIKIYRMSTDEVPSRAKRKVINNDIVFSTIRPNLRHFGILKEPSKNMVVSTGFAVLRPDFPNVCAEIIYLLVTNDENIQSLQAKAEMSVSTYPSINPDDLLNIPFILPTKEVLISSANVFVPQFKLLDEKKKEINLLKNINILLLQRLSLLENLLDEVY